MSNLNIFNIIFFIFDIVKMLHYRYYTFEYFIKKNIVITKKTYLKRIYP